jgi:hypothetical protein
MTRDESLALNACSMGVAVTVPLRVPESALSATIFPDSAEVRPIPDLVA